MLATSRLNGTILFEECMRLFLSSFYSNRSVICKVPFTMRKTRTLGATAAACLLRKVTQRRHRLAGSCIVRFKTKAQGVTCDYVVDSDWNWMSGSLFLLFRSIKPAAKFNPMMTTTLPRWVLQKTTQSACALYSYYNNLIWKSSVHSEAETFQSFFDFFFFFKGILCWKPRQETLFLCVLAHASGRRWRVSR